MLFNMGAIFIFCINGKTILLDTLEKYKEEVGLIGYEVVELEKISKEFEVEIIEIGKSAILIDGVIVDSTSNSNNIGLSFVKIACKLGFAIIKAFLLIEKQNLKKLKKIFLI